MNRRFTNIVRHVMDEWLPPVLRENRVLMYPLFYVCFKGNDVRKIMDFKSWYHRLSEAEFAELYRNLRTFSADRATDLTDTSIDYTFDRIDPGAKTLLDVGCGTGEFLRRARDRGYAVHGCDLFDQIGSDGIPYTKGSVEHLPFPDRSFDVVTCHHTIEHVRNLPAALSELKRVARTQVVITTPRQRYYYYTLDLHIHFFPIASFLESAVNMGKYTCEDVAGDWVYVGEVG